MDRLHKPHRMHRLRRLRSLYVLYRLCRFVQVVFGVGTILFQQIVWVVQSVQAELRGVCRLSTCWT